MAETHFTGLAGQLAVLSELALRGYGVAVPAPDEGDDVIVYDTQTGTMWRIQVKTARSTRQAKSHAYQFSVRETLITTATTPDIHFALVMRRAEVFHPLILTRATLQDYVTNHACGTVGANNSRVLSVTFDDSDDVTFGASTRRTSLTKHLRDYSAWPEKIPRDLAPANAAVAYPSKW